MNHTYKDKHFNHTQIPKTKQMGKQVPFTYSNHTILLDIPGTISINEHTYRLLDQWHLPVFLFPSIYI